MTRSCRVLSLLLAGLLATAAQGAEIRVMGNMTSDVLATGYGIGGAPVGERRTEHMGSTGWLPAAGGAVQRGQDLGAQAPMSLAQLNLRGSAALGDLGVFGDAQAEAHLPDGIAASADGGVHAEWFTGFLLRSDTLPNGTAVPLLFTIVVEGEGFLLAGQSNDNFLLGQFSFAGGFEGLASPTVRIQCSDFSGSCDRTISLPIVGRIGQRYALRGELDLGVGASTSQVNGIYENRAWVSAGNSAHLYLDIDNPAVRHELDDSGLQFERAPAANPVPEPPAWAVMLLGLGLLGARLRGRA